MEAAYWHRKWADEQIGFHQTSVNKRLEKYWPALAVRDSVIHDGDRGAPPVVFVPLCGKSLDMLWLHRQGHAVLGVELSEKAVRAFFTENALAHERVPPEACDAEFGGALGGAFACWRGLGEAAGIRVLVGDFFDLEPAALADIGAFYDRASLIAMDDTLRAAYTRHLAAIVPAGVEGLLLAIDYDSARMQGPPFAVPDTTVRALLGEAFDIDELAHYSGPERVGNLAARGLDSLDERVYRLRRR